MLWAYLICDLLSFIKVGKSSVVISSNVFLTWFFLFLTFGIPVTCCYCYSVSIMSNSLRPHGPQHTRLPCPSLSPRFCSDSCPLSHWCYLTISSPAALVSFCLRSFPASGSFPMSWFFASGGQSIRASASVLPVNIQGWFPSGLTDLIS